MGGGGWGVGGRGGQCKRLQIEVRKNTQDTPLGNSSDSRIGKNCPIMPVRPARHEFVSGFKLHANSDNEHDYFVSAE